MRHHYWEWPIPTYLFLGGLGGGIYCLIAVMTFFIAPALGPAAELVPETMAWPGFLGICAIGVGTVMLVIDLGQPAVFYRAFLKSTSVLAWGARLLTVCAIFSVLWFASYIPWGWFAPLAAFLSIFRGFNLAIAGICGTGIMLYTGIFLSTLKAHSFWATPALPVLFTVSALSTACAAITLSAGWWPAPYTLETILVAAGIDEILHELDIVLIVIEIAVLLIMVLSFLGAGNKTANRAAKRWVIGSYAPLFWGGMICCGLVLPELFYIFAAGSGLSTVLAPILVLAGGLLLRFLVVQTDDRQPLPGEDQFYEKLAPNDAEFMTKWTYGDNIY